MKLKYILFLIVFILSYLANSQAPTITSFTPAISCPNTTIKVYGTNLSNANNVNIGGIKGNFSNVYSNSLDVKFDTIVNGKISITTPKGVAISANNFITGGGMVGYAYITNNQDNTVSVINTSSEKVITTIPVGNHPYGVSVSPDNTKVYISNIGSNDVSVISTATNSVVSNIPVGSSPIALVTSPDGSKVYVSNSYGNSISVINTSSNTVSSTVTNVVFPRGIVVTPDGSKIYVANGSVNTVTVINTSTNTIAKTINLTSNPFGITISPDGSKVYVAGESNNDISEINTTSNLVTNTISIGSIHAGICVTPNGKELIVTNVDSGTVSFISTTTNTLIKTVASGSHPKGVSITPNTNEVFVVSNIDGIVTDINIASHSILAYIKVGTLPFGFGNFIANILAPCIPNIFNLNPSSAGIGNKVSIFGMNFLNVNSVLFGGVPAASFTILNSGNIEAVLGNGSSGSVVVTDNNGSSSIAGFTFVNKPVITSFSPSYGYLGSTDTIKGYFLSNTKSINFGGTPAKSFKILDDSTIVAYVDSGTSGNIVVKNIAGFSTLNGFRFCTNVVPGVKLNASASSISQGKLVTFNATPINVGTAPQYQWFKNGIDLGINSLTYSDSLLNDQDSIAFKLTNNEACTNNIVLPPAINMYVSNATITRIAGDGSLIAGNSGDGGSALFAKLYSVAGVDVDKFGNIYIADHADHKIRKVNNAGTISTFAGNGNQGYSGDGSQATLSELSYPTFVKCDSKGQLNICDYAWSTIRKVYSDGTINTVAGLPIGDGYGGYNSDNISARSAQLNSPEGVAYDKNGNLYFADSYNNRVRKINTSNIITTVAGNGSSGYSGDGGLAIAASLQSPVSVALDKLGNIFIADNHRIRKVLTNGMIITIAGNGTSSISGSNNDIGDGGAAILASINVNDLVVDSIGNIFFTDADNQKIRRVDTRGIINTIAGVNSFGYSGDGGTATDAKLFWPVGLAIDISGNIIFSDAGNYLVRKITFPTNYNLKGKFKSKLGNSIQNVNVAVTGSLSKIYKADINGGYTFDLNIGNYKLTPIKNNDINKTNGITTLDMALIQSHILGKNKLNSPYKIIAADVNGDGLVTTLDIVYLKRLILGLDTTFTKTSTGEKRLWAFVDSSYQFPDTTNPFPFKDSISYIGLNVNKTNQTFIGVKLGDVNWDWNPALARPLNKDAIIDRKEIILEKRR